jgi:multisubunit Na+/H+ antiporter MnhC subunit
MQWLLLGLLFVGGAVVFAVVGVTIARRFIRPIVAEGHNDVLVPLFLTAGVIYAVLLAFMVIAMWESYDAAKANTAEEASLLVPMYRQSMAMSPEKGGEMRKLIREYAEGVVGGWERFRETAEGTAKARMTIDRIIYVFGTLKPETKAEEIMDVQFLQTFSQLMTDRNKRLLHASESLSWVMWLAVAGGGMITIGMSFVLFMDRAVPHIVMTSVLAGLVGLLLLLMAVLNRPFVGPLGVQPEPFESALRLFVQIDDDFKNIRGEVK